MTLKAVIFDMDGLLVDSERVSLQAFEESAKVYGIADAHPIFLSLLGTNENTHMIKLEKALGQQVDYKSFHTDWTSRYQSSIADKAPPLLSGVVELLDWLKKNAIKIALATSSDRVSATHKLSNNGILDYFETLTCGDDVTISKPNPEIFEKAARSIKVDPAFALGLEDSENGVRAAIGAGLHVIQVPDLVEPSDELLSLGHGVCRDLHEVLSKLKDGHPFNQ